MTDIQSSMHELTPTAADALRDLLPHGSQAAAVAAAAPGPGTPLGGAWKRLLDIAVASSALVMLLPLAGLVALLVLITMGRPVLYSHRRIGFGRAGFGCLKFRSMLRDPDALLARHLAGNPEAEREWRETRKLRHDPRVPFVGRMLRKSSLDELPQLLNVLRGEMSCVGPRPVVEDELALYGAKLPLYLSARPGMTGLWQVSGRSSVDYERRVSLDESYVRDWSLWLDLRILARTVRVLLRPGDAV